MPNSNSIETRLEPSTPVEEIQPSSQGLNIIVDMSSSTPQAGGPECLNVRCASSNVPTTRGNTVNFSDTIKEVFVEVAQVDNNERWYTGLEQEGFKRSIRATVRAVHKAVAAGDDISSINGKKHCVRGIEHVFFHQYLEEKKRNIHTVIKAVLDEQGHQRSLGVNDTCRLASVSSNHSKTSRISALTAGEADAMAAYAIYFRKFKAPTR